MEFVIAAVIVVVLYVIFRWVRVFITIRKGPRWHMCPVSSCGFAFRHTGEDEEDLDQTRDIMREHILEIHYGGPAISLEEEPPEENDGKTL